MKQKLFLIAVLICTIFVAVSNVTKADNTIKKSNKEKEVPLCFSELVSQLYNEFEQYTNRNGARKEGYDILRFQLRMDDTLRSVRYWQVEINKKKNQLISYNLAPNGKTIQSIAIYQMNKKRGIDHYIDGKYQTNYTTKEFVAGNLGLIGMFFMDFIKIATVKN